VREISPDEDRNQTSVYLATIIGIFMMLARSLNLPYSKWCNSFTCANHWGHL